MFQQILKKIALNPRRIFLIDNLGALLSAILYSAVLARLESTFGMPQNVLYGLSFLACAYAIYSCTYYFANSKKWRPYLKIIAIANLLHCCLTVGLVFSYYQKLTILGMCYFAGELIIVMGLAVVELKTISYKNAQ